MPNPTVELPPDIDGRNGERAEWAELAIVAFEERTGIDREDAVADLLCDLMHFCDRHDGFDFAADLNRAQGHYAAETGRAPF
jgi:hypothetical protein